MIPQPIQYFCLIVHYGDTPSTQQLVADLLIQTVLPHHLIIIDNQGNYPQLMPKSSSVHIQVIKPGKNHGYAGALNIGLGFTYSLGATSKDVVICLNNDLRLSNNFLQHIADNLTNHPKLILSSKVGYLNLFTGRCSLDSAKSPIHWWQRTYPHGAAFATTMNTFAVLKGLPDKFFLYWEDVAFGISAGQQKYKIKSFPGGLITHDDKISQAPSDQKIYYLVRNGAYVLNSLSGMWGIYWKMMNNIRLKYHQAAGHALIVKALQTAASGKLGQADL